MQDTNGNTPVRPILACPTQSFCWIALRAIAAVILAATLFPPPLMAQLSTTTVQGTIYRADGSPASGTLLVSWPAFTTAQNQAVAAGSLNTAIGPNGVVTLNLTPNAGAAPAGTYYTAVYHLSDGTVNTEYWVVPAAGSASIASIRAQLEPATVAVQPISQTYVDQAIATLADISLPLAGGVMTGPLTLSGDPTAANQAATKHYADQLAAAQLPMSGGTLTGNLSVNENLAASTAALGSVNDVVYASGMKCDGATNDTAAFLSAYNSLPARSPAESTWSGQPVRFGQLTLPRGTCVINPVVVGPGVDFAGIGGFASTTLQLPPGSPGTTPVVTAVSAPTSNTVTVTMTNIAAIPLTPGMELYLRNLTGAAGNLNGQLLLVTAASSGSFTATPLPSGLVLTNGALAGQSGSMEIFMFTVDAANTSGGDYNASFGPAIRNITFNAMAGYQSPFGGVNYGGYNPWASGLSYAGAQYSTWDNVGITNFGVRGALIPKNPLAADASAVVVRGTLWILGGIQGPGLQVNGYLLSGGWISSEQVNPSGTYLDADGDPNPAVLLDGSGTTGVLAANLIETEAAYLPLKVKNPSSAAVGTLSMNPAQTSTTYPTGVLIRGSGGACATRIGNWYTFETQPGVYTNAIVDQLNGRTIPSLGNYPSGSYDPCVTTNSVNGQPLNPLLQVSGTTTSTAAWYLLATLSAPSGGFQPGLTIEATGGGWGANVESNQILTLTNNGAGSNGGVSYAWTQSGASSNSTYGIQAYTQSSGTVTVWLYISGSYGYGAARVVNTQQGFSGTTVSVNNYPVTSQTSTPSGTLAFSSTQPGTFPPTPTVAGIPINPSTLTLQGIGQSTLPLCPSGTNGTVSTGNCADPKALRNCGTIAFSSSTTSSPLSCSWVTSASNCSAQPTNAAGLSQGAIAFTPMAGAVSLTTAAAGSGTFAVACSAN
jgi:hypothetical protein